MKTFLLKICCIYILLFAAANAYTQDIRIKQSDLPYTIPVIKKPSAGNRIFYQWTENSRVLENSNSIRYTIPKGKKTGIYTYISQIKCEGCTDWLNSNPFTVEIYTENNAVAARTFTNAFSAVFSPQKELSGYLEELIKVIDETQNKLDISIYTIDNYDVCLALKRASVRGVQIRMLYDGASEDRKNPAGSVSSNLEALGLDVKYVNKINHHKFIISDDNYLITSSGNWNVNANWVYDENTLFVTDAEIILRYRAEFELLWNNSREFGNSYTYTVTTPQSLLNAITDNPDVDAVFTSSNYSISYSNTYGPTFSKIFGKQDVADKIVTLINQAQSSIKMSANHLRSRPICEALIAKKTQNPNINIKIVTDEQEYITESYNIYQIDQRNDCLANATTPGQQRDCQEENFLYSYQLIQAGIDMRFKCYSYKWDDATSVMMHHKYAIFDDNIIATGSYNYSFNSETNSMENVVVFSSASSTATVTKFISNFTELWDLGRAENYYNDLLTQMTSGNRYLPLLFQPVSLTQTEYTSLKQQTESSCPNVTHDYFKKNGALYTTYLKGVNLSYDANNNVVTNVTNNNTLPFSIDYSYNSTLNRFSNITFHSLDNINYFKRYQYDGDLNITNLQTPVNTLNLSYTNNYLTNLSYGQGTYNWLFSSSQNGSTVTFSNTNQNNSVITDWNDSHLPTKCMDADNRTLQWTYDNNEDVTSIFFANRSVNFNYSANQTSFSTSDEEGTTISQSGFSNFTVVSTGTVAASAAFSLQQQPDKKQALTISLNSTNVSSGTGKTATINYLFDVYGRVVNAGSLFVTRVPKSGEITIISDGSIQETRSYDDWSLLTQQTIKYGNSEIYKAVYQYDGMQRIKQLVETISGVLSQYNYQYNAAGQLEKVYKNNVVTESYTYDNFGNRSNAALSGINYSYQNSTINQVKSYAWFQSGYNKSKDFTYNNSGQLTGTANKTFYSSTPTVTSSKSFNYDVFGNLNSVVWASQNLQYKYDAFDRQIATYLNGAVKRKLVYGIDNLPIAELNENDRIINTFIYADNNSPLVMRKGSNDYYIVSDIRGSVRMVIKVADGNVLQKIDYDAFGKVINDDNPGYTPFGYAGGLYEYRTDLVRFQTRDYFPETGKWTAEDPIGFLSGDVNFYSYVSNDPINYIDISGFYKTGELAIVIGERMQRVNNAADDLKKKGYNVKTYNPRNFRSSRGNLNPKDVNANRSWVKYWTDRNAKVFDIGPADVKSGIQSPFYGVENRSIYTNWEYQNVIQLPGY